MKFTVGRKERFFMTHFEMLAALFTFRVSRDEAEGLAIAACVVLSAGLFVWRVTRFMKQEDAEELESERHGEKFP
jgi:hypothetical protein